MSEPEILEQSDEIIDPVKKLSTAELGALIKESKDSRAKWLVNMLMHHPEVFAKISAVSVAEGTTRPKDAYCRQTNEKFNPAIEAVRKKLIDCLKSNKDIFYPEDILYSIRSQCNLGCRYCYQSQTPDKQGDKQSPKLDSWDAIDFHTSAGHEAGKNLNYSFWGGEPLYDLDETLQWIDDLGEDGSKMFSLQTNAETIRTYEDARKLMEKIKGRFQPGKALTICVDAERSARYAEKYGDSSLQWAKNILDAWLDTDDMDYLKIRYVLMRDDVTRMQLVEYLLNSGKIGETLELKLAAYVSPGEDGTKRNVLIDTDFVAFQTEKGLKKLKFAPVHPFYIGGAETADLDLLYTDEVEINRPERGHPECGKHWIVKPNGDVTHCLTLDYTDVHNLGNISEGFKALARRYNADPLLTLLRDPKNRRKTLWDIASELDPSLRDKKFNPIAPMCQYLFSDSELKYRITKLLALDQIIKGRLAFTQTTPKEIKDSVCCAETSEDLGRVKRFIR